MTLGKRAFASANYAKAEECFSKILDCDPNNVEAIVGQATVAAHQSTLEHQRFSEMVTALDTLQSFEGTVDEESLKKAMAQLINNFVEILDPFFKSIFEKKSTAYWDRFFHNDVVGNFVQNELETRRAVNKTTQDMLVLEVRFFKKLDEQKCLNDPILKEPFLKLALLFLGQLTFKFFSSGYITSSSKALEEITTILAKTESPKDIGGKKFNPITYRVALVKRLKPYFPAGTKLPGSGPCYVATAVYGSYDCPEVWVLRRYRDNTLASSFWGRTFIRLYYAVSPTLVKWFGETEWFRSFWKERLDRMVRTLKSKGVSDTPYED